jgi:hypothetical protein
MKLIFNFKKNDKQILFKVILFFYTYLKSVFKYFLRKKNILFILFFFSSLNISHAQSDTRNYKISILVFKHIPGDSSTEANFTKAWTENDFSQAIAIAESTNHGASNLLNEANRLSQNEHYDIIYHTHWTTPLTYNEAKLFYLNKKMNDGEKLDILLNITLKYKLDIKFKSQLIYFNPNNLYHIYSLNDDFQIARNQIQYIDGPIYSALIKITRNET